MGVLVFSMFLGPKSCLPPANTENKPSWGRVFYVQGDPVAYSSPLAEHVKHAETGVFYMFSTFPSHRDI